MDVHTGYSLSGEVAPPTTHTHPHAALCILLRVMVLEACRGLIINHNGNFYMRLQNAYPLGLSIRICRESVRMVLIVEENSRGDGVDTQNY